MPRFILVTVLALFASIIDASGRLENITVPGISATPFTYSDYDGAGMAWKKVTLPTGATVERDFDEFGRLEFTALKGPDGTMLNRHGCPSYSDRHEVEKQVRTEGHISIILITMIGSFGRQRDTSLLLPVRSGYRRTTRMDMTAPAT